MPWTAIFAPLHRFFQYSKIVTQIKKRKQTRSRSATTNSSVQFVKLWCSLQLLLTISLPRHKLPFEETEVSILYPPVFLWPPVTNCVLLSSTSLKLNVTSTLQKNCKDSYHTSRQYELDKNNFSKQNREHFERPPPLFLLSKNQNHQLRNRALKTFVKKQKTNFNHFPNFLSMEKSKELEKKYNLLIVLIRWSILKPIDSLH